jgi:uroporphyrin-III C-methyltransferase
MPGLTTVLVTRPEREAGPWVQALLAQGVRAEAFPLIEIAPLDDAQALHAAWVQVPQCLAVMFVSANAVRFFMASQPAGLDVQACRAWATGPGTQAALLDAGWPAGQIDAPPADAPQFDSEALWAVVQARARAAQAQGPARVLIVRGADGQGQMAGRDWLAQQLQQAGLQVLQVAAYARRAPVLSAQQQAHACQAVQDGSWWSGAGCVPGAGLGHPPAHRRAFALGGLGARASGACATELASRIDKITSMTSMPDPVPVSESSTPVAPVQRPWKIWLALGVAAVALLLSLGLWQKLSRIQEQLARQSADAGQQSLEAKAWAKQAQDTVKDSAARLGLVEARLGEVALQRSQLEELMQSLSRSRDENLVVDIEAALRMAQQQAQLAGSMEPLLAALKSAQQRVQRAAQPRLAPVQRALEKDLERLNGTPVFDLPGLLIKLDEGVALVDSLVLANQQQPAQAALPAKLDAQGAPVAPSWWMAGLNRFGDQLRDLVRVSRIDSPDAALISPEQSFFLRENLKLKLLNARLGLLARQKDAARNDLGSAAVMVRRYADASSRKTTQMLQLLEQAGLQMKASEMPRLEASLSALSTAAAGR